MDDWNDFRLVLALSRFGSLHRAAGALKVNHSTAYRRLNALEARLGVRLFDRAASGYLATEAGERIAHAAERIEAEVHTIDREITGGDSRLSGALRLTASETLAYGLLTDLLATFRAQHPGIHIELAIDNRELDLSRREADIALRATRPTQGDLFGRKVAEIAWSIYGSAKYLADRGTPRDLADLARYEMIGWEPDSRVKAAEWLAETVPHEAVVYTSNSLINQLSAVKAGIGLAVLPCYIGDREPLVRRALPELLTLTRELWLITHSDLKEAARIRAFFDLVGPSIQRHAGLLEGRMPSAWSGGEAK